LRYVYTGVARDGNGHIISSATIKVYLSGTTTVASVYEASVGGVAVNFVSSSSDGSFYFYVDDTVYYQSQTFKIRIEKTGYTTKDYDGIIIFPIGSITIVAVTPADSVGSNGDILIYESGGNHYFLWKAGDKWYKEEGTAVT
jgi:hypothetical protein